MIVDEKLKQGQTNWKCDNIFKQQNYWFRKLNFITFGIIDPHKPLLQ